MLKNVIIVNDFDYVQGGASKVAIQTANLLVNSGANLNVYFFCAVHDNLSNLDKRVVKICTNQNEALKEKNKLKGFVNGIYNFKTKWELRKLLKSLSQKETIIHVHGWTKALSSSVFDIAFKMKFRIVLTMHDYFTACPNGGYFDFKKNEICYFKPLSWECIKCNCDSRNYLFKLYRIIRQFIQNKVVGLNKKLTDVISISDFSEKILKKTLGSQVRVHRLYNPVDLECGLKKIDNKNNKYYLYVGRVSREKGVDIFCEAISQLGKNGIVVGDGPELQRLKEKYPSINFVGWKNSNDVKKYMEGAIALIFPSRLYETMGLSVIEANMVKIPVIVSSNTSATEFANKNIFENGNVESLKEILSKNDLKVENMNANLISAFNSNEYIDGLIKKYNQIIL